MFVSIHILCTCMYVHVHVCKYTYICMLCTYMYIHVCLYVENIFIKLLFPIKGQPTISFAEFLELMGEILAETTRWGGLSTKLDGYVGFDTIQEQIRKKSLKRGFEFNLMVVGMSFPHPSPHPPHLSIIQRNYLSQM